MNQRVILLILLLIPILALAVPPEPNFQQFYGTVTGVDEALSVKAQAGSKSFEAVIVDGEYGKDTPFLVEGKEGDVIKFFIDDAQVETYTLAIGEVTSLNLELGGESITETEETTLIGDEEALTNGEAEAEGTAIVDTEPATSDGELGEGEAATDTSASTEPTDENAGSETEDEESNISQLKEETKEAGNNNLFTWLIVIGAAFLLAVTVLLLVFWRKGRKQQAAGGEIELFYGETCKHPSHQQYPVHKHERQEGICQALEHKNYPPHRH